jgi:glycerol-3-phosphate acyltransferase PlsY
VTETILYCWLLLPVAAYSLGAVPFGLLLCLLVKGVDIRDHGSKNIGATNAGRVCGLPFFAAAFVLDFAKGLAAVVGGGLVLAEFGPDLPAGWMMILYGALAILGHTFPAYLRFKGGKAVATSFGVFVGLAPLAAGIAFGVWLLLFLAFRYVSLASMAGAVAAPVAVAVQHHSEIGEHLPVLAFTAVVAVLVVVRHRANIKRLAAGTESRVTFKKSAD